MKLTISNRINVWLATNCIYTNSLINGMERKSSTWRSAHVVRAFEGTVDCGVLLVINNFVAETGTLSGLDWSILRKISCARISLPVQIGFSSKIASYILALAGGDKQIVFPMISRKRNQKLAQIFRGRRSDISPVILH